MKNNLVANLKRAKSSGAPVLLHYHNEPSDKKQARFLGREKLVPDVALEDFTCRAVIDWIDLRVCLKRATQFQHVHDSLVPALGERKPHVTPILPGPGNVADTYKIRIQEPRKSTLSEVMELLTNKFGLADAERIVGLEVSIDFTPKEPSDAKRAQFMGVLFRHFYPTIDVMTDPNARPRFAYGTRKKETEHVFPANDDGTPDRYIFATVDRDRSAAIDATLYYGPKKGSVMWRIMDKVIDTQDSKTGKMTMLDETKRRCRIEVTLDAVALEEISLTNLAQLQEFRFSTMQRRFFRFMLPTFATSSQMATMRNPAIRVWQERQRREKFMGSGVYGVTLLDRTKMGYRKKQRTCILKGGTRVPGLERSGCGRDGSLESWKEMARRVEMALRKLSDRG